MTGRYILDENNNAVEEPDVLKWAGWFQKAGLRVATTEVGDHRISTVFLGLDHQFGAGPPLLFETMVFKGDSYADCDMRRYSTHVQALAGHDQMVSKLRDNMTND